MTIQIWKNEKEELTVVTLGIPEFIKLINSHNMRRSLINGGVEKWEGYENSLRLYHIERTEKELQKEAKFGEIKLITDI